MTGRARMFDLYSDAMHLSQFHMPDMRIKFDHAFIIIPKVKIAEKKLIDMIEFFSTFYVKNRGTIHLFMVEDFSDKSFTLVKRIPASYINFDYKILSPPKYWINYYKSVVSALDDVYKHPLIKTPANPFGTNSVYEYELPPTLHNPENNADINNLNAYMIMIFRMSDVIKTLYSYREAVRARTEPFAPFVNLVLDMYESRGMNIEYGNADTLDLLNKTVFSSGNKLKYILNALNQMSRICAPTPLNLSYMMTRTKFNKTDLEKLKIPTNAFELNDLELTDIQYEQRLTQAKLLKDAVNSTKEQITAQADIVYLKLFTDFDRANQTLQSHLEKTCADKVAAHLIAGNELSRHFISNNDLISEYTYDQFTVNKYIIVILKAKLANVWKFSYKEKSMFLHVPGSNKLHELVLFLTSEYTTVLRANYDSWDIIQKQHRGQVTTDVLQNYIDNNIILPAIFVYEEVDRHSEKYKHKMDTERRYDVVWDMYKEHELMRAARARKPVPAPAPEPAPAPPTPVIVPASPMPTPPTPVIVPASPEPVIVPEPPAPRKKSRSRSRPKRVSKSKSPKKVKKVEKRKASKKSSRKKKDSDDSLEKLMKSMGLYPRGGTRR